MHALNLDLASALSDYVTERVRVRGLARAIVENPALDRFFHAAPGVAEVVTLAKLESLARETHGDRPRWHPLFVDLDATGHALMLLELPRVLEGLLGRGPLRRVIASTAGMLTDAATTRLHLVMLPGELVVQETIELYRRLSTEHAVPLGAVFANQMPDAPFEPEQLDVLAELERRATRIEDPALRDDIALARRAVERRRLRAGAAPPARGRDRPADRRAAAALGGRARRRGARAPRAPGARGAGGRAMSLSRLVEQHRLLVCVGPGGVGKTTLAAALALEAARRGRRALVLTIDPARRLADALGLDGLDDTIRSVALGDGMPGSLDAAMLETQKSFDALMRRVGRDAASTQLILENRVYQAFSRTLARSHAYVAMERLYDVVGRGGYDLIVLDTPPLRSALEILDAPGRLASFLDGGAVRWFIQPARGRLSRLLPSGSAAAARLLGLLASRQLVTELAAFFSVLIHLQGGFRERAERIQQILRAPDTGFVLVCAPTRTSIDDAAYLRDGLLERGAPLVAAIFNRAWQGEPSEPMRPVAPRAADPPGARLRLLDIDASTALGREAARLLQEVSRLRAAIEEDNAAAARLIHDFSRALPASAWRAGLPELAAEVRDLSDLLALVRLLDHVPDRSLDPAGDRAGKNQSGA